MTKITFREATTNDIEVLEVFELNVIEAERPFNDAIKSTDANYYGILDLINSPKSHLLVAEYDEKIIATGYVQIRQSKASLKHAYHGYLGFMYVLPEFRGRGINKSILEKLISWGSKKQIVDFYLDVYSSNQSAIRAYEKVGFNASLLEMKLSTNDSTG
jgi:ribosomal protein S18 acetylase RimI-like enzyme